MLEAVLSDETGELPAPWQWPGLWSLNLPFFLFLWQILLADTFRVWLADYHFAAVPALAWVFIAAERWIFFFRLSDRRRTTAKEAEEAEEARATVLRIALLIVVGLILVALFRATSREAGAMLVWTSLGGAYLVGLRLKAAATHEFLPREMGLAIYLAGAGILFVWANTARPPIELLLPGLLFLLLLFYYFCLTAARAKAWVPVPPTGSLFESELGFWYRAIPATMILVGVGVAFLTEGAVANRLLLTIGVSGALLVLLDLWQTALSDRAVRILADVALLTPLVPLAVGL